MKNFKFKDISCVDDEIRRRQKDDIGLETRLGKRSLEMPDKSNYGTSINRDDENQSGKGFHSTVLK